MKFNLTKFILAGIAGFAAVWFFGALWHLILFKDFFSGPEMQSINRPSYILPIIILGDLLWAFGLAYLYPLIQMKGKPAARGLKIGLITGVMRGGIWAFIVFGVFLVPTTAYLANALAFSVIQGLLGGLCTALVYKR